MTMTSKCPYKVGDTVRFIPSKRTKGLYQKIERFGLEIGEKAVIKEIRNELYLYFEGDKGGFPWNEFELVKESR